MRQSVSSLAVLLALLPARAAAVPPQASGSGWAFALPGGPRLEVDPTTGARLSSLKQGTSEFLFLDRGETNWGATFWTAPQSVWNWPPPEALDRGRYTGGPQGQDLVLVSARDPGTGFAFAKRISATDADTSFTIALTVRNPEGPARQAAPWMITRVLPGGLTFFPKGPGAARGDLAPLVKEAGGWAWFDHGAAQIPGGIPKYFADGAGGWMAHLDKDGLLLLEVFPDLPAGAAAPEEAEIEIYTEPGRRYMEIEHQGAYATVAPGDSLVWTTRWFLRRLPADVPRKTGDAKLVEYVTRLVRLATAPASLGGPFVRKRHRGAPSRPSLRVFGAGPGRDPSDAAGRAVPSPDGAVSP